MNDVLKGYFARESVKNQQAQAQKTINSADSVGGPRPKVEMLPGKYVMKVASFAWKDKKKNNIYRPSPEIFVTDSNALMLNICLEVVKATPMIPEKATMFHGITLIPKDEKKIDNTMRMLKPILVALTGTEDIKIEDEWMSEYLTIDFKQDGEQITVTRDHKMKKLVYVTISRKLIGEKVRPYVKLIQPAKSTDESFTDPPSPDEVANTPSGLPNAMDDDTVHASPDIDTTDAFGGDTGVSKEEDY